MFLCDYHLHTRRSFDGELDILQLCSLAVDAGLLDIAITDHCDCNEKIVNYSYENSFEDILRARDKFGGKINIRFGVELGQPTQNLSYSNNLIKNSNYDFVLGSLHNLNNQIDFYFYDFHNTDMKKLINDYFGELLELIEWGNFDVLGHLDYFSRYIANQNVAFDMMDYKTGLEVILKKLIEKNVGIEVNTSSLRSNLKKTMPSFEMVKFYKELGGQIITVGSDAHQKEHIGMNIQYTLLKLKDIGFDYVTLFENRKPIMQKISI